MFIKSTKKSDIELIHQLEIEVEKENAASLKTLQERFELNPEGCFVAKKNNQVVGYCFTILCDDFEINTFRDLNFNSLYNKNGKTLYVIFIAVDPKYRKQHIATKILKEIKDYASFMGVKKIKLVAKSEIIGLYDKQNFKRIKLLPDFLDNVDYDNYLMELRYY